MMDLIIEIVKKLEIRTDLCIILLVLMALDIVAGVVRAISEKEFKSKIFREGIVKKLFEIIIIVVGYLVDYILEIHQVGFAVLVMMMGAEAYSIVVENASKFINIPEILRKFIENLRGEKEEDVDNGERF